MFQIAVVRSSGSHDASPHLFRGTMERSGLAPVSRLESRRDGQPDSWDNPRNDDSRPWSGGISNRRSPTHRIMRVIAVRGHLKSKHVASINGDIARICGVAYLVGS